MHSLEEARSWIEARVDDVYGSRVGQVVDVYFDPGDQQVHWMLVRLGSPGEGPLKLVPVHYSIASEGQVWVPMTKDLIGSAPDAAAGAGLDRDRELELCFHYGGLRGRSGVLRAREAGEVTAAPGAEVLPFRARP